jgi:hypothetical protein
VEGASGRAPLLGKPKDEDFEKDVKCPVSGPPSLQGPFLGNLEGVCLPGLLREMNSISGGGFREGSFTGEPEGGGVG